MEEPGQQASEVLRDKWFPRSLTPGFILAIKKKQTCGFSVYEILTQNVPYSEIRGEVRMIFAITGGKLPLRSLTLDDSPAFFRSAWKISESYWASPPDDRIIIKEVVHYLRSRDQLSAGDNGDGKIAVRKVRCSLKIAFSSRTMHLQWM